MASVPTITEPDAMATVPLATRRRTRRLLAVYAFLALLAVVTGIAVGVQRHGSTAIGSIVAPTEQSLIATAPPGVPTPTPLATRLPSPTPVPPTESAPTTPPTPAAPTSAPPTPAVAAPARSAPAVATNQNRQGNGKSKGKDKGGDGGD